jgi:hypothetical protein
MPVIVSLGTQLFLQQNPPTKVKLIVVPGKLSYGEKASYNNARKD